jgi:MarR-like DNA-binding transcriptional regulator SgrR of sgrS sRNA
VDRAVALLLTLLASRPTPGGTITIALWEQPVGGTARWSDQVITLATAEGLYRDGKPALAIDDPSMLAPQIARVRVRPQLFTQNGQPVSAADVAARIQKQGLIQQVRAMGDIIELTLSRPSNAAEVAAALSAPESAVPRMGPFVLAPASQSGPTDVRLDAWNAHHAGRPWLNSVILRAFPKKSLEQDAFALGKLQVMLHGVPQPNDLKSGGPVLFTFLGGLSRLPPNVQQAIPLAIDRDAVRKFAARAAQTAPGPAPNVTQAHALLGNVKGPTLALLCDSSRNEDYDAAQKIQTQLARVGLQVRIDTVPAAEFERRVAANTGFDFYVAAAPLVAWPNNVLPLYSRSLSVRVAGDVRGMRLDALGRLRFDDAFLWHP